MTNASGRWDVTIESPLGRQRREMNIEASAESFTAAVSGDDESHAVTGVVSGDRLTWSDKVTSPMKLSLQFDVTVSGDAMTGVVKLGIFGKAKFTATRASKTREPI